MNTMKICFFVTIGYAEFIRPLFLWYNNPSSSRSFDVSHKSSTTSGCSSFLLDVSLSDSLSKMSMMQSRFTSSLCKHCLSSLESHGSSLARPHWWVFQVFRDSILTTHYSHYSIFSPGFVCGFTQNTKRNKNMLSPPLYDYREGLRVGAIS